MPSAAEPVGRLVSSRTTTSWTIDGPHDTPLDDMPRDVRDRIERLLGSDGPLALGDEAVFELDEVLETEHSVRTTWRIEGRTYSSVDEMPAEVRALAERMSGQGGPPLAGNGGPGTVRPATRPARAGGGCSVASGAVVLLLAAAGWLLLGS